MIKRILTLSCILLAVATFAIMTVKPAVTVKSLVPQLANPGDEFMVKVSIDKGPISKGAVLQQAIPNGFTATAIENEGAHFYFENQMVRFVWDKMPAKHTLVVAYKIKVDISVEGFKKLNGTFIYEQDNNTAQADLPTNLLYITNDFPISNAKQITGNAGSLSVRRTVNTGKGEFANGSRITIDINNENETGFASWTDQIPDGYTVEVNAANNATFSTEGSKVKFYWEEMPKEKSWSFSYTIYSADNSPVVDTPELIGIMVYGTPEMLKTCIPANENFTSHLPATANNLISPIEGTTVTEVDIPVTEAITEKSSATTEETELPVAELNATSDETEQNIAQPLADLSSEKEESIVAPPPSAIPTVQRGTYYRVQIAATKRSPLRDSEFFQTKYNIQRPVDMIEQDGWKKYCIGTFARLEPAKSFANETRSSIPDAFVVAYRDGVRVPVEEAMEMLSISQ